MSPNPKLIDKWSASLPRDARRAISGVIAAADACDASLYLVGGPLRDLLLGDPSLDIDLVAEGDAIGLAQRAARYLDSPVKTHPTFGTATLVVPPSSVGVEHLPDARGNSGERLAVAQPRQRDDRPLSTVIDIATARTETYAHPGALPKTAPAAIEQDLLRRDFTINAMALRLNGPDRGRFLDPAGGLADIDSRLIRTLHARSFQDDPTRILRAARYAARLGFSIERRTLASLKRSTSSLQRISGARLHHEFTRIFEEPAPEVTLQHLDRLGVLAAIHPALRFQRPEAATFQNLRKLAPSHVGQGSTLPGATPQSVAAVPSGLPHSARSAYWPALALRLSPAEAASIAARLALTSPQRAALEAMAHLRDKLSTFNFQLSTPRSALAALLAPCPLPALWALAAASTGSTRSRLLDYLTTARHIRPVLRGHDLIALGVPEGPAVGDTLRRLHAAKLDGEVKRKTDEIRLVQAINTTGDLKGGMVVGQRLAPTRNAQGGSLTRPRRVRE